jgi:hypothetical protein
LFFAVKRHKQDSLIVFWDNESKTMRVSPSRGFKRSRSNEPEMQAESVGVAGNPGDRLRVSVLDLLS